MHTIVPATIIVAGVLNGALVSAEEIAKFPEAWNGRPIPILHPTQNGKPISANAPDVLERAGGYVFNVTFDTDRLRAEFWLDEDKFTAMGQTELLTNLQTGKTVEVSTGYFCESLQRGGEHGGKAYREVHVNLRPDHVALLPNQTGACSIADGCGAPRINEQVETVDKSAISKAISALGALVGLNINCACEDTMKAADIHALVQKLTTNGANLAPIKTLANLQTNFDIAELEKLSDQTRGALAAALKSLDKAAAAKVAEGDEEDPTKKPPMANAAQGGQPVTAGQLAAMIADGVKSGLAAALPQLKAELLTHTRRADAVAKIMANQRNALSEATLNAMSEAELTKYGESIAEVDFSGLGAGFTANAGDSAPLGVPRALMAPVQQKAN
jgi:hypothetical protein